MMKHLYLIFFGFLYSFTITAQWQTVGDPYFTGTGAFQTVIKLSPSGEPYMVYRDGTMLQKAHVQKFNGSAWVNVGIHGFSAGDVNSIVPAFSLTGELYVVYTDEAHGKKATVKKLVDSTWVTVGTEGFTPDKATHTYIAIDTGGKPHITFLDHAYNGRATVMKFDGADWVYVGTPGFSDLGTGSQGVMNNQITFDENNKIYVSFCDISNGFKASVMTFDGTSWSYLGGAGFSAWQAGTPSIALDSEGTPYVAYSDRANSFKATVMKFDGSSWVNVGSPGFTDSSAQYTSMAIGPANKIYVAYRDRSAGYKATVMAFDGSTWTVVGTKGISSVEAWYTTIAIDPLTETIYTGFREMVYTSSSYGATVMKYNLITGWQEPKPNDLKIRLYPNPAKNKFSISCPAGTKISQITVRNIHGIRVFSESYSKASAEFLKEIDLGREARGMYYVEILADGKKMAEKIILN